jgi:transcriptional regulator with XRE-family HTH domain
MTDDAPGEDGNAKGRRIMSAKTEGRENEPDGPANGLEAFALELKAQREAGGLTQEQLAKLMGYSTSVIAKLETCRTVPSPQHADRADDALRMPGTFRRLRKATINGTYEPWFQAYLDIEERATVLRSWQPLVVDGLLQTEAYARGVLRGARPTDNDAAIEQLVTARMSRQEIWERKDPDPPVLSVILAEGVLRQPVGDAQVMHEQLSRLAGVAENPRITIQLMPSLANAHPGLLGPFVVASFENSPDAAYLDNALNGQVTERRAQVAQVALLYDTLRSEALSPGASIELIKKVDDETWRT